MSRHAQRHRDAFWLIIFNIIAFIIIIVVCYLTLAKIHINDKTNLKSQTLRLGLFTPN